MPRKLELFTAGCRLCNEMRDAVIVGKCNKCNLIEYDMLKDGDALQRAREYGIRTVPTLIVDGSIKIEGLPDFPLICGDGTYERMKREFGFK